MTPCARPGCGNPVLSLRARFCCARCRLKVSQAKRDSAALIGETEATIDAMSVLPSGETEIVMTLPAGLSFDVGDEVAIQLSDAMHQRWLDLIAVQGGVKIIARASYGDGRASQVLTGGEVAAVPVTIMPLDQLRGLGVIGDRPGIYFLWRGPELLYVGQSIHVETRLADHRRHGFVQWERYTAMRAETRQLEQIERDYIRAYGPPYNTRWRQQPFPAARGDEITIGMRP